MKDKKHSLLDGVLECPESVLISLGLLFVAVIILLNVFWDESTGAFKPHFTGQAVLQEVRPESVIIDLNTADIEELTELQGIGDELAKRIVQYREEHGNFHSVEELINVKGIGKAKLDEIRYYLTCSLETEPSV